MPFENATSLTGKINVKITSITHTLNAIRLATNTVHSAYHAGALPHPECYRHLVTLEKILTSLTSMQLSNEELMALQEDAQAIQLAVLGVPSPKEEDATNGNT